MTNTLMRYPSVNTGSTLGVNNQINILNEQSFSDNAIYAMINSNFDSHDPNKFISQFPPGTIDNMSGNNFVNTDVPMTSATAGGLAQTALSPEEFNENLSFTLTITDDDYVDINNFFENLN